MLNEVKESYREIGNSFFMMPDMGDCIPDS